MAISLGWLLLFQSITPAQDGPSERLGELVFENSGAVKAQEAFLRGVLLLHSFEYDDAAEAFRAAQELDSDFALAYWGESLTYCHPIWNEDNPKSAHEALARLAPTTEERLAKAPTERERGLLAAAEVLWGDGERLERNRAYAVAMERLHARFPDDLEITAFTSVAILGSSGPTRDIPTYMRAAALAERVYEANRSHPGGLHYAIHAYDDPVHAALGLRMAERYAQVAPAAQHALHMPSHIFVALGMWRESASTNEASIAAADARRARKALGLDARGYHSIAWLAYSYLQLGRHADALALLERMEVDAAESKSKRARGNLASMQAAHAVDADEERAFAEVDVSDLELDVAAAERFSRGMRAVRNGDLALAQGELEGLMQSLAAPEMGALAQETLDCCRSGGGGYGGTPQRQAAEVMRLELEGAIALGRGDEAGLALLREATAREDAMGFDFGPPKVVEPAHELLGATLFARGDAAGAVSEFEAALDRAPGRARSLLGLARAQVALGDAELARATYAELAAMWKDADADLRDLAEVRARSSSANPAR